MSFLRHCDSEKYNYFLFFVDKHPFCFQIHIIYSRENWFYIPVAYQKPNEGEAR